MQILDRVKELIEPFAAERGILVVDITYAREGGRRMLRVTADKEGGITMDECARLNNELGELLDRENVIDEEYTLEISSPGLDRKLKSERDFAWAVGKKVRITTYAPVEGRNSFLGTLCGLGDETLVIEEEGVSTEIPRDMVAGAKLDYKKEI